MECGVLPSMICARSTPRRTASTQQSIFGIMPPLMTSGALFPLKKPDLDNVMKIVCDALNGIAYKDDVQIVNAKICKRWSSEMPSVWVTICSTEREGENDERKEV